jgi:hypothetical protein
MGPPPMALGTGVVPERPNCRGLVQAPTQIRIQQAALVTAIDVVLAAQDRRCMLPRASRHYGATAAVDKYSSVRAQLVRTRGFGAEAFVVRALRARAFDGRLALLRVTGG